MNQNPGCLSGLLKLFLIDAIFDFLQSKFGFKRGGCCGCGCGVILLILSTALACGVLFNTEWLRLSF